MALRMSKDLVLPVEATTEKTAFLGRTGSGKTYAAQKLAEEIDRNDGQFVALDPVGKWWSLRLAADGSSKGMPVPVFGGLNGDIPLEPTAGRLIADVVADRGISAVIDVSQFESDRQKNRFANDFGDRFFFRKKAEPSAVHLFLEEAQEFVPQNPMGDGDKEVLHVFTRMWKLGRNYGIGGSLITQRPQEVNKKVLNLTEVLFCFQLTGTHERKAVAQWILDKGLDLDVEQLLPKLRQGEPHVWSPVLLNISKTVRIGKKWTYDASSTPKVGRRAVVKTLAPIDLAKLQKDMAATIERAKTTDPKLLQQQVRELERKLAAKIPTPKPGKVTKVEVPLMKESVVKRLEKIVDKIEAMMGVLGVMRDDVQASAKIGKEIGSLERTDANAGIVVAVNGDNLQPSPKFITLRSKFDTPYSPLQKVQVETVSNGKLPQGEKLILTAVAQACDAEWNVAATKQQITVVTGYKRSTRDAYLARLNQKGYVELRGQEVIITEAGRTVLGPSYTPLPTGPALAQHWIDTLPEGEGKILYLLTGFPGPVDSERITENTGYKRSTRDAYLARLKARKLVIGSGREGYTISQHLRG